MQHGKNSCYRWKRLCIDNEVHMLLLKCFQDVSYHLWVPAPLRDCINTQCWKCTHLTIAASEGARTTVGLNWHSYWLSLWHHITPQPVKKVSMVIIFPIVQYSQLDCLCLQCISSSLILRSHLLRQEHIRIWYPTPQVGSLMRLLTKSVTDIISHRLAQWRG